MAVNQIEESKNLAVANIQSENKRKLEELAEEYKHYNTASKHLFWVAILSIILVIVFVLFLDCVKTQKITENGNLNDYQNLPVNPSFTW